VKIQAYCNRSVWILSLSKPDNVLRHHDICIQRPCWNGKKTHEINPPLISSIIGPTLHKRCSQVAYCIAVSGSIPWHSYGMSLAIYEITQCYLLPDTSERAPSNPCSQTGRYSIYLPRRDGRLSWSSWLESAPAGSQTSDLSITSPMLNQDNHTIIQEAQLLLSDSRSYYLLLRLTLNLLVSTLESTMLISPRWQSARYGISRIKEEELLYSFKLKSAFGAFQLLLWCVTSAFWGWRLESVRAHGRCMGSTVVKSSSSGALPVHLFSDVCWRCRVYRLATMHSVTDRQTDRQTDSIIPTDDHILRAVGLCSAKKKSQTKH